MSVVQTDKKTCRMFCEEQGYYCSNGMDNAEGCEPSETGYESCDRELHHQLCHCSATGIELNFFLLFKIVCVGKGFQKYTARP